MKQILQILAVLIVLVSVEAYSQNPLKDFDGIPIMTGLPDWGWTQPNLVHIDSMKKAGIDFVNIQVDNNTQMNALTNLGLKVIPNQSKGLNYIQYYTDAKYTVWETEDTPQDTSYLQHDPTVMYDTGDGIHTYIKLRSEAANNVDTLVWGPYYSQHVYELDPNSEHVLADYTAAFNMKLELNTAYPDTVTPENMNDTICIIQVTQSYIATSPDWHLACTYVVQDSIIPRWKFLSLNLFQDFNLIYTLDSNACYEASPSIPPPQHHIASYSGNPIEDIDLQGLIQRHYIEFKVIWLGNPRYLISIDKITVYDQKGYDLIAGEDTLVAKGHLLQQASSLSTYNNYVAGWFGIDEPNSIDNYLPIKRVIEILNNYSNNTRPLWLALMGKWDGVYNHHGDKFGTYHLSPWKEMKKRIGSMNVWQDVYYLDYPYRYNYGGSDTACNCTDYRAENIEITAELNYKQAHDISTDYGVSIQCGEIHIPGTAEQRNIFGHELLYETNLALLEGAKFLTLYTYFAQCDTDGTGCGEPCTGTSHGIIDFYCGTYFYTGKYDTLYRIINPRLKGCLGKTLKNAIADTQFVAWDAVDATDMEGGYFGISGYDKLERINSIGTIESPICDIELGFFHNKDDADKKYFMALNRYFSNQSRLVFSLKNLNEYNNWELRDYIEDSRITLNAIYTGTAFFNDTIGRGDARLYSVLPVVKYGGKLIADETISVPTTLHDDMTIENGATLYVNSAYTAKGNIIVKNGGKIVGGANGTINFDHGYQIFVEGSAQVYGTVNNRLRLNFSNTQFSGIKIKQNASLSISFCEILGSAYGILSESRCRSVVIAHVNISNCQGAGIALLGSLGKGGDERTTSIKNCSITNCGYGIYTANFDEIVIMLNTITDCRLGITALRTLAAHIIGNYITTTETEYSGIMMVTSDGNIRDNTVRGHTNGIALAYSSPNIGGNTLEGNSDHGVYVSIGSIPNLQHGKIDNPVKYLSTSGYNIIRENGVDENLVGGDGSEIYLKEANILLDYGCNQIVDDRPASEPRLLMNGSNDGNTRATDARYNYWGTVEPSYQRFGSLVVNYTPFNQVPYYGPCQTSPIACEELMTKTSKGELISEVEVKNCDSQQLSELELKYSEADMLYLTGEVSESKTAYQQITDGLYSPEEKLYAYNKLYTIGNLIDTTDNYFTNLQTIFNNLSQTVTDSTLMEIFAQNSILCKVSKEEYASAIVDYDNIIQQNPESEKAVYAEIDIITTALLVDTIGGQLGKVAGGKYLVKGSGDYLSKMNELMIKNFGKGKKEKEQIIPTELALSQNYPNPFNPTTKIKYQLPNAAQVQLKVYDILGREVASLVNEEKQAGYYQVDFNASDLSSDCYFYQIVTKDFIKTMKMLMLK